MEELFVWPEVAQATCPYYDATTFYAPNALEKLFEHVLEAKHIDWASPWCLFCGMEFEPETTEWKTVRKVVNHWVEAHLDKLTAVPDIVVNIPDNAMPGDEIQVTHTFNLVKEAKSWYKVSVYLDRHGVEPIKLISDIYTADDLGRPECFPGAKSLDHTGEYSETGTVIIPETPVGLYTVVSQCIYYELNKWGTPGTCSMSKKTEYVVWREIVGHIQIGEPVIPLIACYCPRCTFIGEGDEDMVVHIDAIHPNAPMTTLCSHLDKWEVIEGDTFRFITKLYVQKDLDELAYLELQPGIAHQVVGEKWESVKGLSAGIYDIEIVIPAIITHPYWHNVYTIVTSCYLWRWDYGWGSYRRYNGWTLKDTGLDIKVVD